MIYSAQEVLKLQATSHNFWIEPYIPEQGIVLCFGKYGTYKTPLTLSMARCISEGQDFLGLKVRAGRVLYIEADTPRDVILERAQLTLAGIQSINLDISFDYPGFNILKPSDDEEIARIHALQEAHRIKCYNVVFIDSLRCLHSLSDKDSEVVVQVYRKLANMFPSATVVLVHHDRKTKSDDTVEMMDESFSGSQAWVNHATVGLKVAHHNKQKNEITLRHTKSQASELQAPLLIKVNDGATMATSRPGNLIEVQEVLTSLPPALGPGDQDRAVAEVLGISHRTARRRRKELENEGQTQDTCSDLDR